MRCRARLRRSRAGTGLRHGARHYGGAEAGKRITGLELSERMLERAVKKRRAPVERVNAFTWSRGDMAKFDLGEKFRL